MTAENRVWSDPAWVTYITPFRLIVPDGEVPLESSLDEINGNTYNHGKLSKIVGTLPLGKQDLKDFNIWRYSITSLQESFSERRCSAII